MKRAVSMFAALLAGGFAFAQTPKKVLFDHTKHEDAGTSAYWIIDTHEPNPSPAAPTSETSWNGAISQWAFDLYKKGYTVQTLPASGGRVTYGDSTNAQDLSNYAVYVIPECYYYFTAAEKTAIYNFVQNGGGLFLMSNHLGATRLSGTDSTSTDAFHVFNDLGTVNGTNIFGWSFVVGHGPSDPDETIEPTGFNTSTNAAVQALVNGPDGKVSQMEFSAYSYLQLDTTGNASVQEVLKTPVSGDTGYLIATSTYGKGRVIAITDSAPSDDGTTTTSGKSLYVTYSTYNNRAFFLNSIDYLASASASTNTVAASITNPSANMTVTSSSSVAFAGSATDSSSSATLSYGWNFGDGASATGASTSHVFTNTGSSSVAYPVTLTATDSTGASGTASRTITVTPAASGGNTVKATIATPSGNVTLNSGVSQSFAGTATDSASGPTITYTWNFGDGTTASGSGASHAFTNTGTSAVSYTVTFTATDQTGASGSATRTVTVNPATSGGSSLSETFESGTKASYSTGNVTLATGSWSLNDSLLGNTSSDRKDGSQSVRTRNSGMVTMNFNFATGAKTVTIKHALYGSDSSCKWGLWYSTNSGSSWTQVGSTVTTSSTTLTTATFTVNKTGAIRFQIRKTDGSSNRINFDDFKVAGY